MHRALVGAIGAVLLTAVVVSDAMASHSGCGFLGLQPCAHRSALPDPGGNHNAVVPNVPPGRLFGFNSVGFWRATSDVTIEDELRVLRAAGGNFFRTPLPWNDVEPTPGQWNEDGWERYAQLVRALREYNPDITILFELAYAPDWAGLGDCPWLRRAVCLPRRPPAGHAFDEFADYAVEIIRRFDNPNTPKIDVAIETWNEPNLDAFWEPYAPDPGHMTRMQCAVYNRVKSVYPDAIVTSAAINGRLDSDNRNISMERFLDRSYEHGLGDCMDRMNVHLAPKPESEFPNGQWNRQWDALKRVMAKWGDLTGDISRDRWVWVTETSASTAGDHAFTPAEQLAALRGVHAKLFTMDTVLGEDALPVFVEEVSIHTTTDVGMAGRGVVYGAPHFKPKPVLCHFDQRAGPGYVYPGCGY